MAQQDAERLLELAQIGAYCHGDGERLQARDQRVLGRLKRALTTPAGPEKPKRFPHGATMDTTEQEKLREAFVEGAKWAAHAGPDELPWREGYSARAEAQRRFPDPPDVAQGPSGAWYRVTLPKLSNLVFPLRYNTQQDAVLDVCSTGGVVAGDELVVAELLKRHAEPKRQAALDAVRGSAARSGR